MSADFWNDRYAAADLVYGDAPNDFLASLAGRFPPRGRALDLGSGEGRNALFLAAHGLDVTAVDQSTVGLQKAERLARLRGLSLHTQAVDLAGFTAPPASFDIISSIFVHLPTPLRASLHARVRGWLRPGGLFILEAYAPDQIARDTGGPKDPALLASLDTLIGELHGLTIEHRAALVRHVSEGPFHTGDASVVQVLAHQP